MLQPGQKVIGTIRQLDLELRGSTDPKKAFVFRVAVDGEPMQEALLWLHTPKSRAAAMDKLIDFGLDRAQIKGSCMPYLQKSLVGQQCKLTMKDSIDDRYGLQVAWIDSVRGGGGGETRNNDAPFDEDDDDGIPPHAW